MPISTAASPAPTATIPASRATARARPTTSGDLNGDRQRQSCSSFPPAMPSTTFKVGGSTLHLDSHRRAGDVNVRLARPHDGRAAINLDLPISRRNRDFSALGNLTLNANAEVDQLSDFGTLTTIGAGANWSPVDRLNFITSWTREEGAPTIQQLGDPVLETPGTRIFDFITGQTVLVTAITGGNPDLAADRRNVFKLGANWQPFAKTELGCAPITCTDDRPPDLQHHRDRRRSKRAFPERFVARSVGPAGQRRPAPGQFRKRAARHAAGRLRFLQAAEIAPAVAIGHGSDARPVRRRPRTARSGSSSAPGAVAGRGSSAGGELRRASAVAAAAAAASAAAVAAAAAAVFGGGNRGRLQFSLTDTITFVDKVTIAPGVPELDYLHGDAAGSSGGTPRHQVEAQAGWYNNGLGARARRQLAQRHAGRHADRRRSPFLAARDVRFAAVRQSRRHSRARGQASVAARHAGAVRGQEHLRQPSPRSTTRSATCRSIISPTCSTRSAGRS